LNALIDKILPSVQISMFVHYLIQSFHQHNTTIHIILVALMRV